LEIQNDPFVVYEGRWLLRQFNQYIISILFDGSLPSQPKTSESQDLVKTSGLISTLSQQDIESDNQGSNTIFLGDELTRPFSR
jgi:hypothetical protein